MQTQLDGRRYNAATSEPEAEAESFHGNETVAEPESEPLAVAEDEVLTQDETVLWTVVYVTLILATIAMNILIICAMIKKLSKLSTTIININTSSSSSGSNNCLQKPADLLLLSLIVARTNVALFVMPARVMGLYSAQGIGSVICKMCSFAGTGSATTSVLCTCAVAITKVIDIQQRYNITKRKTGYIILALWIIGHVYAIKDVFLSDIVAQENARGETIFVCGERRDHRSLALSFLMSDFMLLFIVPSFIVIIYSTTFIHLSAKSYPEVLASDVVMNVAYNCKSDTTTKTSEVASTVGTNKKGWKLGQHKNIKSRYMTLVIMFLFILCYAAAYTWKLLAFLGGASRLRINTMLNVEQTVFLWTFLNPVLNGCVYLYFRADIRERFRAIFKQRNNSDNVGGGDDNGNRLFVIGRLQKNS